jgi:hypothetical protein
MKVFMMIFLFIFFGCENQKKNIEVVDVDEVTDEVDTDVDEVTDEVTDEADIDEVTDEVTDEADVDEVTDEADVDEVTDEADVDEVTDDVDADADEVTDDVDADADEVTDEVDADEIDFKQFFSNKVIRKSISNFFLVRHARRYCDELEENGFSDWRLPSLKEGQLLIKECQTMNPFETECIINDEKIKGCTRCTNDVNYALFEEESEFFLTDSEISNGILVGAFQPKFSFVNIISSDGWQAVRCIRGNPFATE